MGSGTDSNVKNALQ